MERERIALGRGIVKKKERKKERKWRNSLAKKRKKKRRKRKFLDLFLFAAGFA